MAIDEKNMDERRFVILKTIAELREEGEGDSGGYYEKYGSAIYPALLPLAHALESLLEHDYEKAYALAKAI